MLQCRRENRGSRTGDEREGRDRFRKAGEKQRRGREVGKGGTWGVLREAEE